MLFTEKETEVLSSIITRSLIRHTMIDLNHLTDITTKVLDASYNIIFNELKGIKSANHLSYGDVYELCSCVYRETCNEEQIETDLRMRSHKQTNNAYLNQLHRLLRKLERIEENHPQNPRNK